MKHRFYFVVVQAAALAVFLAGAGFEFLAFENILNWISPGGWRGYALSVLGTIAAVIAGGTLMCCGWFIGMICWYERGEQR